MQHYDYLAATLLQVKCKHSSHNNSHSNCHIMRPSLPASSNSGSIAHDMDHDPHHGHDPHGHEPMHHMDMMKMHFHTDLSDKNILIYGWDATDGLRLTGTLIAVFLIGLFYEKLLNFNVSAKEKYLI